MRIITPNERSRHRDRRLILFHGGTSIPEIALLGAVCTKVDAAIADALDPDIAVQVKLKILAHAAAAVAGEDFRGRTGKILPRVALECEVIRIRPGLVVEEADCLRWCCAGRR